MMGRVFSSLLAWWSLMEVVMGVELIVLKSACDGERLRSTTPLKSWILLRLLVVVVIADMTM
jgi:hypothetical protein